MFLGLPNPNHYYICTDLDPFHQAKIVRKTLISTVLWLLYDFLSLKNSVNTSLKSNRYQQNLFLFMASWMSLTKSAGSGSSYVIGMDPDPYQNITDPQHFIEPLYFTHIYVCLTNSLSSTPTASCVCRRQQPPCTSNVFPSDIVEFKVGAFLRHTHVAL
jgi:hypothetical protein